MKYLFLIVALLTGSVCFAQQVTTYLKSDGKATAAKDSAAFTLTITGPDADKLYSFKENFITGELLCEGKISKPSFSQFPDNSYKTFYPSGQVLVSVDYENGKISTLTTFYPDGKVYLVKKISYSKSDDPNSSSPKTSLSIITCNAPDGKPLVSDGNGSFISYEPVIEKKYKKSTFASAIYHRFFNEFEETGSVKNGLYDGVWTGKSLTSSVTYVETFKEGKLISGKSVDKDGKKYEYKDAIEKSAEYPGGISAFYAFIGQNVHYPTQDRQNLIQGRVFASFIINKDGHLVEIKIIRTPTQQMADETLRVLEMSPAWLPGSQHGIPVRQMYTVPVSFTLNNK